MSEHTVDNDALTPEGLTHAEWDELVETIADSEVSARILDLVARIIARVTSPGEGDAGEQTPRTFECTYTGLPGGYCILCHRPYAVHPGTSDV